MAGTGPSGRSRRHLPRLEALYIRESSTGHDHRVPGPLFDDRPVRCPFGHSLARGKPQRIGWKPCLCAPAREAADRGRGIGHLWVWCGACHEVAARTRSPTSRRMTSRTRSRTRSTTQVSKCPARRRGLGVSAKAISPGRRSARRRGEADSCAFASKQNPICLRKDIADPACVAYTSRINSYDPVLPRHEHPLGSHHWQSDTERRDPGRSDNGPLLRLGSDASLRSSTCSSQATTRNDCSSSCW